MSSPRQGDKVTPEPDAIVFLKISSIILANFRVIINEGKNENATGTSKK